MKFFKKIIKGKDTEKNQEFFNVPEDQQNLAFDSIGAQHPEHSEYPEHNVQQNYDHHYDSRQHWDAEHYHTEPNYDDFRNSRQKHSAAFDNNFQSSNQQRVNQAPNRQQVPQTAPQPRPQPRPQQKPQPQQLNRQPINRDVLNPKTEEQKNVEKQPFSPKPLNWNSINPSSNRVVYKDGVIKNVDANYLKPNYLNSTKSQFHSIDSDLESSLNNLSRYKPNGAKVEETQFNHTPKGTPIYKIRNLFFDGDSSNKFYKSSNLYNISLDLYSKDRIALLSDNGISENLFIDLLKNNEKKAKGYIFANHRDATVWEDEYEKTEVTKDPQNIKLNNLLDINYELIIGFKNRLSNILNKVIAYFKLVLSNEELSNHVDLFFFSDKMDLNFFELSISEQNRFILLLDILVGKRIVYVNQVSLDLTLREKITLYRFLNETFTNRDNLVFVLSNDITELKILCNRVVIFSKGNKKEDLYFKTVLDHYESVDDFIILNLR